MRPFFKDESFNFQTEVALGATYHQAADVGEVLATVERIRNGQAQSWVDEWSATADRLAGEATASAAAGRSHSAADQFLRVSMYCSVASYMADGTRQLYDKLPAGKTLIRFTEKEGADSHCEPAANGIRGERIFDWLDQHIPA